MPVIKGPEASTLSREAIVLDLGDISRQASRILQAAQAKAQALLDQAEQEAQQRIDGAKEQGFEEGLARGREEGVVQGREQGREEAFAQAAAELQQLQQAWRHAAEQCEAYLEQVRDDAREAVLALALRLAEKVVHRAVEVHDQGVVDQVAHALSHVLEPLDVTVTIHPEDRPLVEAALPELAGRFTQLKHLALHEDEQISRGGCVVSHATGRIDATLDTQLRRAAELLMPEGA